MIVYTCITGNYEKPFPVTPVDGVTFLLFTDNEKTTAPGWEIVKLEKQVKIIENNYTYNPALINRPVKIYPWNFDERFKDTAEPFLYIDGNIRIKNNIGIKDIKSFFNLYAKPSKGLQAGADEPLEGWDMLLVKHWMRNCLFQEAQACIEQNIGLPETIKHQVAHYRKCGMPENFGLWSCGFLLRHNSKRVRDFCYSWLVQVATFPWRDQISFPWIQYNTPLNLLELHRDDLTDFIERTKHR